MFNPIEFELPLGHLLFMQTAGLTTNQAINHTLLSTFKTKEMLPW